MMFPVSESIWAEAIYMYICQDYMYQMYVPQTKHIETLEKILCILQYRSIGDEKGTFYDFKTHIDCEKKEARITYISDILNEIKYFTEHYHYVLLAPFVAIFVVHYIW